MDRAHWTSPSFRGRSPHQRHQNPRFRGDGNFGTPSRHFSPHWQQRSPSPYRGQHGYGGSYSPHYPQSHHPHPYATSTPVHGSGGGRRPFFRGGGRFNKRPSFGPPSFGKGGSVDDIDCWISPEMWADPWRYLTGNTTTNTTVSSLSATQISNVTTQETGQEGTRFAESDFNITPSNNESFLKETKSEDCATSTKFADSDFNITTDTSEGDVSKADLDKQAVTDSSANSGKVEKKEELNDEDFEKLATDRVVFDSDDEEQLLLS